MTTPIRLIDTHTHVFLPQIYGFSENRSYTPGSATLEDLQNHLTRIGATKVVIVQPSPYGTDNRAAAEGTAYFDQNTARFVAVVDPENTTAEDLIRLEKAGAVGVRANLKTNGTTAIETAMLYIRRLAHCLSGTNMFIEVFLPLQMNLALADTYIEIGRTIVLDHWAGLKTPYLNAKDISRLEQLLEQPNIILKTSGTCRATNYDDADTIMDDIAPRLINAAKSRTVWGSDWPHTGKSSERVSRPITEIEPFMTVDDLKQIDQIIRWSGDHLDDVLYNNANRLMFSSD